MIDKKNLIIFCSCLGIVLLVFTFFSLRQAASLRNVEAGLKKDIEDLRVRLEHLEFNPPPSLIDTKSDIKTNRSVKLIAPNGGESLCLGKNTVVRWESEGVKAINLTLRKGNTGYSVGDFPASFNESGEESGMGEFSWLVGEAFGGTKLEEGYVYEMVISGADSGSAVFDKSDRFFSMIKCEG